MLRHEALDRKVLASRGLPYEKLDQALEQIPDLGPGLARAADTNMPRSSSGRA